MLFSGCLFRDLVASELAIALAISVFPQPGGPYNNIPRGVGSLCSEKSSG